MSSSIEEQIANLKNAIAAQEGMRAFLGDEVVNATVATLREKLKQLEIQLSHKEQRKQSTVLFADVSGFTAMSETMDAEEVNEVMNAVWSRIDAAILDHGGMIDKHIGDAVMALWGVSVAHENDPEQAIRAALAMQNALHDFVTTAPHFLNNKPLAMRIGLNTGPVMLGTIGTTNEFTAMGDTVNLASRLEHAAPVGGILISHDTYRHVRGIFDVVAQEPMKVKGKTKPIQTYVIQRAKTRGFRVATRGVEGIEIELVGRDVELQILQNFFHQTISNNQSGIITITGEAGVGKSRLLYEFDNWLELLPISLFYLKGRAVQQRHGTPFALLRDLFAFRFGVLESDTISAVREKFEDGIAETIKDNPRMKAHFIGTMLGYDFSDSPYLENVKSNHELMRQRAQEYLNEFFASASQHSPAVIMLEDTHWADNQSLLMVQEIVANHTETPLLIIAVARPELIQRHPEWLNNVPLHEHIPLQVLDQSASAALVEQILQKVDKVPKKLCDIVVKAADGNPFYVEELIKVLIDDGVIQRGNKRWTIATDRLPNLRIPPTLTAVIQARLDRLDPDSRTILQQASVVGRIFWDASVAALHGTPPNDQLSSLNQRELIFSRDGSTFEGAEEYIFKHAMTRDVTYETVLLKARRTYHHQIAGWLAEAAERNGRLDEYHGVIAAHYEQANENLLAAKYLNRAGNAAYTISAFDEAIQAYQHALELLTKNTPETEALTLQCKVGIGKVYAEKGNNAEATEILEPALELARQRDDRLMVTTILGYLARVITRQGNYAAARPMLEEALELARDLDDKPTLIYILRQLGNLAIMFTGAYDRAKIYLDESLQLARQTGDLSAAGWTLNSLGVISGILKEWESLLAYFKEVEALGRQVGDRNLSTIALGNQGGGFAQMGDHEMAQQAFEKQFKLAHEIGNLYAATRALGGLGTSLIALEKFETAQHYMAEGMQLAQSLGDIPHVLHTILNYCELFSKTGHPSRGLELLGVVQAHPACNATIQEDIRENLSKYFADTPQETIRARMEHGKTLDFETTVAELIALSDPE